MNLPLSQYERHELETIVTSHGWSHVHALDLFTRIQRLGQRSTAEFQKTKYPRSMMPWLQEQTFWEPVSWQSYISEDGSTKYISTLSDGKKIETLFMPTESRDTVCLSTQAGCAMGCTFCATGTMGLLRQLTASEILQQVRMIIQDQSIPPGRTRRLNLQFMGMGEPLHNFEPLMKAFRILVDPKGLGFPELDIGVSTCGYLPGIKKLALQPSRPALMLSIGSTQPDVRTSIMPINKAWPLSQIIDFLKDYPVRKRERFILSFVLIAHKNDTLEEADGLVQLARQLPCLINLIPLNPNPSQPDMDEPEEERIQNFYRYLLDQGIFCTIRRSRGRDIRGGCGQFFQKPEPETQL